MDGIAEFLEAVRRHHLIAGRLRGVFHIAIGRRITTTDGRVLSTGVTWRDLSAQLKQLRFDKDLVKEIGADPDVLAPRDRQRMWYSAIGLAQVNSLEAYTQAEELVELLSPHGFLIGPSPSGRPESPASPADTPSSSSQPTKKSRKKS
ncbi:MAG: hypothetical protein LC104_06395 [Bacteroidales bacterium]|nr:hypothetical protein [Bacteroidales bacterium]